MQNVIEKQIQLQTLYTILECNLKSVQAVIQFLTFEPAHLKSHNMFFNCWDLTHTLVTRDVQANNIAIPKFFAKIYYF